MTNHSDTLASFGLCNICTSLANINLLKQKVQLLQRMLPIAAVNPFCHNFFPIKTPNHNMRIQKSTLRKLYSRDVFYNSWFVKISLYITSCSSQYSFLQHIWCRYCKQTMVTEILMKNCILITLWHFITLWAFPRFLSHIPITPIDG